MKKGVGILGMASCTILAAEVYLSQPVLAEQSPIVSYHPSSTLTIVSYSSAWGTQARLREIYQELLQNQHGKELELLRTIRIFDGYPQGRGEAGEYQFSTTVDHFGHVTMEPGLIDLYGGHDRTTIPSLARTLSHEYGHHVTHYYTLETDGIALTDPDHWKQTTFARLRGLGADVRAGLAEKSHRWQVPEIAAEDYVQLFGSANAKIPTLYASREEQALAGKPLGTLTWNGMIYNVVPQENNDLPLAIEVPGEYEWLKSKMKPVSNDTTAPDVTRAEVTTLSVNKATQDGRGNYKLNFVWNSVIKDQLTGHLFTLVTWRDGDTLPEPVVTRMGVEPMTASYGSFSIQKPLETLYYKDPNAVGVHHFRVFDQWPNGFVTESNELVINMDHPSEVTSKRLQVTPGPEQKKSLPMNIESTSPFRYLQENLLAILQWVVDLLSKWMQLLR